jgi:NADP-reducing hydrogenase subunit HndB
MVMVKSLADLKKLKADLQTQVDLREKGESADSLVQVKVAWQPVELLREQNRSWNFLLTNSINETSMQWLLKTGCMGYCYAEPTVEIKFTRFRTVVFGYVNVKKSRRTD